MAYGFFMFLSLITLAVAKGKLPRVWAVVELCVVLIGNIFILSYASGSKLLPKVYLWRYEVNVEGLHLI